MRALLALAVLCSGCLSPLYASPAWAEDPPIHPGMRLYFAFDDHVAQCTAGFLFRVPDQTTYLSTAAHCMHTDGELEVGAAVYAASPYGRNRPIGTVVFDGWDEATGDRTRDIALIRLEDRGSIRMRTSAAVPAWGGPLGVAAPTDVTAGATVLGYGNAADRPNASENPNEGWLVLAIDGNIRARFDRPSISGDSGGPLLSADGRALGTLHGSETWAGASSSQVDIFTPVDGTLALLRSEGPAELQNIELATWHTFHSSDQRKPAANGPPSSALPSVP